MTENLPPLLDPTKDLIPANELQLAQVREIAVNGVENLQKTANNMQDNAASLGRWILASLLAVNSGGAVGVLANASQVQGPLGESIVAFAVGAVLAIATGLNGLLTSLRLSPVIGDVIERLRLSAIEGVIHSSTRMRARDMIPIARQQLLISSGLALGSIGAFALGVWSAVS